MAGVVKLSGGAMVDIGISAGWAGKQYVKSDRYTLDMSRDELVAYFREVSEVASEGSRRYFRGRRGKGVRGGVLKEDQD